MLTIKIAELVIGLETQFSWVDQQCRDWIVEGERPAFVVSASDEELLEYARSHPELPKTWGYFESLLLYRKLCRKLTPYDALVIHGAAIEMDGRGYVFLAGSGVGKTTHIRLWQEVYGDRVNIVNGDKPILRRFGGRWFVCGTPWQGKEDLGRPENAPLNALCFLERCATNTAERLSGHDVTERIFTQVLLPESEADIQPYFDLLGDLMYKIPCLLLRCAPVSEAARIACNALTAL